MVCAVTPPWVFLGYLGGMLIAAAPVALLGGSDGMLIIAGATGGLAGTMLAAKLTGIYP